VGRSGKAAALLEQGRYAELLTLVGQPAPGGAGDADGQATLVAAVRCRLEQGYLREAADLARGVRTASPGSGTSTTGVSDPASALGLWHGFLGLYAPADQPFARRFAEFAAQCDRHGRAASQALAPLAADLEARAETLGFVLSGGGPAQRGPLLDRLADVAEGYRAAGLPVEALAALRRAASFAAGGLPADRERSRALLIRARDEAAADGRVIAEAAAELALAEADLRVLLDGGDGDLGSVPGRFSGIADAFRQGGHAFGDALVQWSMAGLLLRYGLDTGLDLAAQAAAGFAAADAPSSELQVWSALGLWHTLHGDPAGARQTAARSARLVSRMGFVQATEVRDLDEANRAFRSGDVALARELLTRDTRSAPGLQAASRLMLATSANAVGLAAEARALLEGVVADLTATGASLVLGEALALLANLLAGDDDTRARELLRAAAAVARAAQSPVEEAKYRGQLAWTLVTERMRAGQSPCLSPDADAWFAEAERLLAGQRTLEAGGELAKLQQFRGQAAFFDKDWDQVGTWLSKAEATARAFGLRPDLAFILTYQSLVMIDLARRAGPATYDQAARLLAESRELFKQAEIQAFVWQTGFYQALCDIEAARAAQPEAKKTARLDRASVLMEEASGLIDELRQSAERGAASAGQAARMAFSVDKQVFYREGFQLAWDARADPAAAWRWLERMKGRALLDGLSDDGGDARPRAAAPGKGARRAAAQRSAPPDYAEVRDLLAAEEAAAGRRVVVAEYLCTPERTMLFGARADWTAPRVEHARLDHAALRSFAALTFRNRGGFRMLMQDQGEDGLRQWHRFAPLLAPVADWADRDDIVYLVPHGLLHDLPLHTLPVGQVPGADGYDSEPLLERNPVCYVPASAVLRHSLRGSEPGFAPGSAAVFGDSRCNLRSARDEAAQVAAILGVAPMTGAAVTRERVLDALEHDSVVHIAGHGELSITDGFASGLDLAGVAVLRAADLLGRPSRAQLAVLSGCETGVSELRPGDEAVGLIRALLLSGVRSTLASQWRVNDASTSDLLRHFHEAAGNPGVPIAEALRRAARAIRADPERRHPYHWGGFALVGSWR
jgi:CHAT domain